MITQEQREARRSRIQSSDLPAIVGVDPWSSQSDIYYSKRYRTEDRKNSAMTLGNRLETVVLDMIEEALSTRIERDLETIIHADGINGSNLDGRIDETTIVEAKTSGIANYSPEVWEEWGEEYTDEVPTRVLIQCHHQLAVSGASVCYVGAILGGRGFRLYRLEADPDLGRDLLQLARDFWTDHVEAGVAPIDAPSLDLVRRIIRDDRKRADLSIEEAERLTLLVEDWERLKEIAKETETSARSAQATVIGLLGDAEEAVLVDYRILTFYADKRGARTLRIKK